MSSQPRAVRPSLNVATQEELDSNSLSHHGETEQKVNQWNRQGEMNEKEQQNLSGKGEEGEEEDKDLEREEYEDDEAREPITRRAPKGPTKEEREKHEATHLPFREWCDHCARGRARNRPHRKKHEGTSGEENKVS